MGNQDQGLKAVATELEGIKKLLIFALLRNGSSQRDVAKALGVNQSTISRMFPKGLFQSPESKKGS